MDLVGVQLGHYTLTKFIKGGGMGEVYLAKDLSLPRQVAIKVMKSEGSLYPDSQAAQEAARLFQREMLAIAMLDHPNILTLFESGEQKQNQEQINYMVMPYCPAGSLADWIKQYHGNSLLTPQEVSHLLTQAAAGLQHAHEQGILHLDIKPQNFLVRRQQNPKALPNLLLADFGVAKFTSKTRMSGTPRGTYLYMAPEQLANKPVPASDQYALAIMVYELLTGKIPFEEAMAQVIVYQRAQIMPDPPSKVNSSLPQILDTIILHALAIKPEERFSSVIEFAQAFADALNPVQYPTTHLGNKETLISSPTPPNADHSNLTASTMSSGYTLVTGQQNVPPPLSQQRWAEQQQPWQRQQVPPPPQRGAEQYQHPWQGYQPYPPQGSATVQHPPARKGGLWWTLLFGVIAGGALGENANWAHSGGFVGDLSGILLFTIPIITGFIVGKIVLRKWAGALAGAIAGIMLTIIGEVGNHFPANIDFSTLLLVSIVYSGSGALLGFIGGWIASWGRRKRRV